VCVCVGVGVCVYYILYIIFYKNLSSSCSTPCGVWPCEKRPITEQKRHEILTRLVCVLVVMWVVAVGGWDGCVGWWVGV
jgi:hypothetical protein